MFRHCSFNSGVRVGAAIAIAAIGLSASAQTVAVPPMPSNLQVPAGNTAYLKAYAEGTQNYVCLPSGSGLAWKFQAPQATLFITFRFMNREVRQQIATHFLSPNPVESGTARATWQSSVDTSSAWAVKEEESTDPAYVQPGAIAWLRLRTVGTLLGPTGGSMLAETTFIQRVNTSGGSAPATGCNAAGDLLFVPYTTDYIFYKAAALR
jgi:hypothetical protein